APSPSLPGPTTNAGVWTGSELIVFGSDRSGGRYDPATDTWARTSTRGAPISPYATGWTGSEVIVIGWPLGSGALPLDVARYDPAGDTWYAMAPNPFGSVTVEYRHAWTGSELVFFRGFGHGLRYGPKPTG